MSYKKQKRILVFGDSNTFGWKPETGTVTTGGRWDDEERFTGIMQTCLGPGFLVITEGLGGRTTVWDDPIEEYRCGKDQIIPCMESHGPLDLVIIFLGTNDLKARYTVTARDIANSACLLADKALHDTAAFRDQKPRVLLICPPPLGPVENGTFRYEFQGGREKSLGLYEQFRIIADSCQVPCINAGDYVHSSQADGVHLDLDQHEILGRKLAEIVRDMLQ
ncbi:MAG: SGNH/GDSL hydrolase family protein [Lachnospiraceae bacterium]